MKKPLRRRRVFVNRELRNEFIQKGFIITREMVPGWLRSKGYEAAAEAAEERLLKRYV